MSVTAQDLVQQGEQALVSGDFDGAKQALTAAIEKDAHPAAHYLLGAIAFADEAFVEGRRHLELAYRGFRDAGKFRTAARAATDLALLHYSGFGNESASRGWLQRAERLLEREGRCVERGYLELALVACDARDASRLEESAATALDLALEFGDSDLEVRALADGGLALVNQGRLAEGFRRLEEAMAAVSAGEVRSPILGATIFCAMLTSCERTGDIRRAEEWTRIANDFLADRFGERLPVLHAHCRVAYGTVLCDAGRWPEAEAELSEAMGGSATTKCVPQLANLAGTLAGLRLTQGRVDEAAELLAPYFDRFEVCEPLARLHLARGELDLAAAVIARGLHELVGDRLRAGRLLSLLVDVDLARGDLDSAAITAERLADYAQESDSPILRAQAGLADGRVAARRGDRAGAIDAFEAGLQHLGDEARPSLAATIRLELADQLAESGDAAAAIDEARAALSMFERLGVEPEAERAAKLLVRLGAPGRPGARV